MAGNERDAADVRRTRLDSGCTALRVGSNGVDVHLFIGIVFEEWTYWGPTFILWLIRYSQSLKILRGLFLRLKREMDHEGVSFQYPVV